MADGLSSLNSTNWGTSTGGAAGSAESTLTLGVDRADTRTPPDVSHIWGAQINNCKNLLISISATFKGGTRLGVLTQSSNPFGANESGFYIDTSGGFWGVYNGAPTSLSGGAAALGNYTFTGNNADVSVSGAATLFNSSTNATSLTIGNTSAMGPVLINGSRLRVQQSVQTGAAVNALSIIGGAHTSLTASTEYIATNFQLNQSLQFLAGTVASQRHVLFQAPTYTGATATANFTNVATVAISGAPTAGTNAAFTSAWALWIQSGNLGFGPNAAIGQSSQSATNTTAFTLSTNVADGASSIGLKINNLTSTTSAISTLWQNNGNNRLQVELDTIVAGSAVIRQPSTTYLGLFDSSNAGVKIQSSGVYLRDASNDKVLVDSQGMHLNQGGAAGLFPHYATQSGTSYTVLATDTYVGLSNTAARAVTLPAANAAAGQWVIIKDEACTAGTGNITISRAGADTIVTTTTGNTSVVLNSNGAQAVFFSDGVSKWFRWV